MSVSFCQMVPDGINGDCYNSVLPIIRFRYNGQTIDTLFGGKKKKVVFSVLFKWHSNETSFLFDLKVYAFALSTDLQRRSASKCS